MITNKERLTCSGCPTVKTATQIQRGKTESETETDRDGEREIIKERKKERASEIKRGRENPHNPLGHTVHLEKSFCNQALVPLT